MTPLQFEQLYTAEWQELKEALTRIRRPLAFKAGSVAGERVTWLYRRACEQLALARARSYPGYLTGRLEQLTQDAHQLIYQRPELGVRRLARFVTSGFPQAVREHAPYVAVAAAAFALPALVLGWMVYMRPDLVLTVVDASTASGFEEMYSDQSHAFGRLRAAQTDWEAFGYYINNNISVAFQCFGSGLFAGAGSLFFLAYNGAFSGAVGGYLTQRGLGHNFYAFIVTHSAFELTAIVLSGAAGLRIGHSLLAPGRRTRVQALVTAARASVPIIYGVAGMLLVAAAIEAFWSSATWMPLGLRYTVAAVCWAAVLGYLGRQGRHAG
jgi:uncharacterized membrane protein SpoIIM required for sporulation